MDEQSASPETLPPPSSFISRASNVFASPGEVFSELAVQPVQTTSWLIPLILMMVMMVGTSAFLLTNDTLRNQVLEKQHEAVQKMVDQGKLTQEQADKQLEMMEGSKLVLIFGSITTFGMSIVVFFAVPLVVWLAGMMLMQYHGGYFKIVEMFGLTVPIGFLGGIVTVFLMNIFMTMYASPSGWLLIMQSYDPKNFLHNILSAINIFTLWQVALLGLGLSKLSGKSTGTGMGVAFGLWAVVVLVIVGISSAFR